MEIPASAAADVDAPLIECALKIEVSIPDLDSTVLIHLAIVALDAGPCGFVEVKKSTGLSFDFSWCLHCSVLSQWSCSVATGQMLLFSVNRGKKYCLIALPGWHCLGSAREDADTPSGEKAIVRGRRDLLTPLIYMVCTMYTRSLPSWSVSATGCVGCSAGSAVLVWLLPD